jgi:predicted transcriptional regulator
VSHRNAAPEEDLSRRERQIMDVLLRRRQATASMVRDEIPDPPSYDAVRTTLRILAEKGYVVRKTDRPQYVYAPAIDFETAREHALTRLVRTFYQGSAARAALALLKNSDLQMDEKALNRLEETIVKFETEEAAAEQAPQAGVDTERR